MEKGKTKKNRLDMMALEYCPKTDREIYLCSGQIYWNKEKY